MDTHDKTRTDQIITAIELGVDIDDFRFDSLAERSTWHQLESEVIARLERDDCCWSLEAA